MRSSVFSRITRRGTLIVSATLLAMVNCEQVEVTTVSAARVELQPQNTSVAVSESVRLTAQVLSSEGKTLTGRTIDWTSLQPNIASVDNTGMVRGMTTGLATIRAVSGDAAGSATITVTAAPSISLSLSDITFSGVQNGAAPGERTVTVTNGGTGTLSGLTATVRYGAGQPTAWLTASLATASAPTALIFAANQRNLTPGTYSATVDVTSSAPGVATRSIIVRLTVVAPAPAIGLGANTISFSATQGGADPGEQTVGVTNAGGGSLTGLGTTIDYQTGQPTGWLTATLTATSAPTQVTLRATTGTLSSGNYTANVRVTSALAQNSPQTVAVTFVVQNMLALSPSSISYLAARGGGNPLSQTVLVTGTQLTGLTFSITYGNAEPTGWASAALSATTSPATLTVNAATLSLPTGIYSATLAVASPDASNSPQMIQLGFNVVDPLNPPTSLTATAVSSAQIDLAWTAPGGSVGRYRVERKTGASGTYAFIDTTTTTTYQSGGLNSATEYYYRVSACNGLGCSPPSAEANATTLPLPPASGAPSAPSGLSATPISATQVDLKWTAPSSGTITSYRVERQDPGGSFLEIAQVPDSTTAFSSTGLVGGAQYDYRVRACNQNGCSAYSNTATALTYPNVPANLTATVVSSSQIDLSWSASTGASNYIIERQINGGSFLQIATVTVTTHSDTGLTSGAQYSYQVKACNATGCSAFSPPVSATSIPGTPTAPTNLQAVAVSPAQIDLKWSAAAGSVSTYEVERRVGNAGTFAQIGTVTAGTVSYSDITVAADSQYGYRVRACSGATCSGYSNVASAKTPKLPKPGTPSSLTATAVSPSQINLAWSPGSGSVDWHFIERSSPGVSFTRIDSIAGSAAFYANTSLTDSTTYTYRVTACNAAGCSGHSNNATATTPLAVPGVPQNLLAASAGTGTNQINLAWTTATGRVARYEIEAHRLLQAYGPLATVLPPTVTYRHTGLPSLTIWTYRVRACNSAGCSGYSNETTAFAQ
jgi:fibronectin type 3 domain-containing protein